MSLWLNSTISHMYAWPMSRWAGSDWTWLSGTSVPSRSMSMLGAAASDMGSYFPSSFFIETTSASLSFTVQVARSGTPLSENTVYLVDSDSITQRKLGTVLPQVTTQRCGRRLFSSGSPGEITEAMVLSVATLPAMLWLFSNPSNVSSRLIVRPCAPVNSSWIPFSGDLFDCGLGCQGTDRSTWSSLGLYWASTEMPVSTLAMETTPDFSLGCWKLLIGRNPHFVLVRCPSEPGCPDTRPSRASRRRSAERWPAERRCYYRTDWPVTDSGAPRRPRRCAWRVRR